VEARVAMINNQRIHPGVWFALGLAGLMLQGCADMRQPEAASGARVYSADMGGGARSCTVPKLSLADGKPSEAPMTVGNDGGWCALTVAQSDGRPYDAGLLKQQPGHGKVLIHEVGDSTRIDYTPDPRFTGTDSFQVMLIPGDAVIRAAVTVVPPGGQQAAQTKP
jgi:hypothetical protein